MFIIVTHGFKHFVQREFWSSWAANKYFYQIALTRKVEIGLEIFAFNRKNSYDYWSSLCRGVVGVGSVGAREPTDF